jgi:serine/threonine protein kinase
MPPSDPTPRGTIGPYRIVARVGAGGMGEVFKAWDPRLERDVAIKVLHPSNALDPERQRRLLAEGRAASALCHPNILRVYDADMDGTSYYLVSEWLEGKSLRDELSRGPLPLKRLLDLSVQIADGLTAAHAIGIVHRDIKPENVMLARDGTARIVDFGLARSAPDTTSLATEVGHGTTVSLEGGLSGTPAYMSPEQARGNAGDFRTDQFSFGALLYEMATGTFAFRRDSVADTLSAVLHEEPKPVAELNPRVPAPFRWMLERCLAKDVSERYAATEDLARELRGMRDHWSEALAEPKVGETSRISPSRWKVLAVVTTAAIAGVALGLGVSSLATETSVPSFTPLASASEYEGAPSWSPDGQSVAYVADVNGVLQVFIKRVTDPLSRQVTHGQFDAQEPFWAPDGQRVYFISLAGEADALWSVGVAGGRPELIVENVAHAAIDRDGSRLALLRGGLELWWSSPPRVQPRKEVRPPFDRLRTAGGQLRFSADGQLLVWTYDVGSEDANRSSTSEFYVIPRGAEAPRKVLSGLGSSNMLQPFDWLPDNRHVIVALTDARGASRHLWMADTRSDASQPITATHTNETAPAVSPDGRRIAYASDEVDFDLMLISPNGATMRTMLATARNEYDPTWSAAGDQFAFVTDRSGFLEIWARSRDGQWERPIVTVSDFGGSRTETLGSLAFSPDGRTLAYQRGAQAAYEIWLSPAGGGTPTRLGTNQTGRGLYQDSPTWSPDGEWLAFHEDQIEEGRNPRLLVKRRIGTNETIRLSDQRVPGQLTSAPVWSPDGRWIADQTENGLMRVPADGGSADLIDTSEWLAITWAPDSRRLYALGESEISGHFALMEIDTVSHQMKTLNPDLGAIPVAIQPIRGFSFAKGQGFLTSLASARSDIWLLEGFHQPPTWLGRLFRR